MTPKKSKNPKLELNSNSTFDSTSNSDSKSNSNLNMELKLHFDKVKEKLNVAEELFNENYYDDSVSRLYYAIFHAIGAILRWKKVDLNTHKHVYIINQFKIHFIDTRLFPVQMLVLINHIKSLRESADYSIHSLIDKEKLQRLLEESVNAVDEIQKFLEKQIGHSLD